MGDKRLEYLKRKGRKQGYLNFREARELTGLSETAMERRIFEFGIIGSITRVKYSDRLCICKRVVNRVDVFSYKEGHRG